MPNQNPLLIGKAHTLRNSTPHKYKMSLQNQDFSAQKPYGEDSLYKSPPVAKNSIIWTQTAGGARRRTQNQLFHIGGQNQLPHRSEAGIYDALLPQNAAPRVLTSIGQMGDCDSRPLSSQANKESRKSSISVPRDSKAAREAALRKKCEQ